jgi:hypothetical protein
VTLISLELLTVIGVPVNAAWGTSVPNPFPLIATYVPREFSVTHWMIGISVSCAVAEVAPVSSNATRKEKSRLIGICFSFNCGSTG